MAEVLLVNPRRRKPKTKARRVRRRRDVRAVSRRRRKFIAFSNPRPRKRRRGSAITVIRRRRFRRNPIGGLGGLFDNLMPTLSGAGGALLTDIAMGYIPLPAALSGPMVRPLVKGAVAFGVGMVIGAVAGRRIGDRFTAGALTVVAYDAIKNFVAQNVPGIQLGAVESFPRIGWSPSAPRSDMGALIHVESPTVGELVDESTVSGGVGAIFQTDPLGELVDESTVDF